MSSNTMTKAHMLYTQIDYSNYGKRTIQGRYKRKTTHTLREIIYVHTHTRRRTLNTVAKCTQQYIRSSNITTVNMWIHSTHKRHMKRKNTVYTHTHTHHIRSAIESHIKVAILYSSISSSANLVHTCSLQQVYTKM